MKHYLIPLIGVAVLSPIAFAGEFTAGFYSGDGGDGHIVRAANANEDMMVQATIYTISPGVTITTSNALATGNGIIIRATERIIIEGTLSVNGKGRPGQAANAGAAQSAYGFGGNRGSCAVPPPGGNGGVHGEMATLTANWQVFDGMDGVVAGVSPVGAGGGGGLTGTAVTTCGGGGGAGSNKDGGDGAIGGASTGAAGASGAGGEGGGYVVLIAPQIILGVNGVITANGTAGTTSTGNSGAAGGGAGGLVFLHTEQLVFNGTERIYVQGGNGGASSAGPGGIGGARGQPGGNAANSRSAAGGAGGEIVKRIPTATGQPVSIFTTGLELGTTSTLNILIILTTALIGVFIWRAPDRAKVEGDVFPRLAGAAIVLLAFGIALQFMNAWTWGIPFAILLGLLAAYLAIAGAVKELMARREDKMKL